MEFDSRRRPTLVVVSGRPGSGKSTLARALASALSCPLVSRDEINEGIFHTFDHDLGVASKDHVAKVAFDAFFGVIELLVSSSVTLVAEAAFQDLRWRIGLEPLMPIADMKVIHCTVDPELAVQRVIRRRLERQDEPRSKRARVDVQPAHGRPLGVPPFEPLSLPVPSMRVTTTDGYDPPLNEIVGFVRFRR